MNYQTPSNAYSKALQTQSEPPFLNSGLLQYNIVLSELWNVPGAQDPTADELTKKAEAQTFLAGSSYPASIEPLRAAWPLPPDDYSDLPFPAEITAPMLWLAGGMDTRTPPGQAEAIKSLYPTKAFVVIPGAGHTPAEVSPLASDPTQSCGEKVVAAFIEGDGVVDTSCEADLLPVPYHLDKPELSTTWWGTSDEWGDDEGTISQPLPSPAPGAARGLGHGLIERELRALASRGLRAPELL